jgi:toluene monooxygenase system ferredoxin subunit
MTKQWYAAMDLDELWEGEMDAVEVAGTNVLLLNLDGDVRAYHNRCPHQAWPLHEGDLDGQTLTCSRHLWEFNARTGHGINPDNCQLVSYPCKVEDGTIFVELG